MKHFSKFSLGLSMNITNEIQKLVDLKNAGHLTEEEFTVAKRQLLDHQTATPTPQTGNMSESTPNFRGPPHECWNCGGPLRKIREAKNQGSGCIIIILGILFLPLYGIGLIFILYGMHLSSKVDAFWQCKRCDSKFPRKLKWYELG